MSESNRITRRAARLFGATLVGGLAVGFLPGVASATPPEPPPVQSTDAFCANVPASFQPFTDIGTGTGQTPNTFATQIRCLAASEITGGGPGGRPADQYGPGLEVSRDQMATFIARLMDTAVRLDAAGGVTLKPLPADDGGNNFTDVSRGTGTPPSGGNVHASSINRLSDAGIVKGGPGGRPATLYGPGLPVRRDQMASFINRAIGFLLNKPAGQGGFTSNQNYFLDDNGNVHEANIQGIASEGIAVGDGVDRYDPARNVPRDQMAAFLVRPLSVLQEQGIITALPAPTTVTLTSANGTAGQPVTGTIAPGTNIQSVTASGPCVQGSPATLTDTTPGGDFQFSVPTTSTATGSCTITFTITRTAAGGGGSFTRTATVNFGAAPASTNVRPELVSATIVSTTAPSAVSPTNPVGTTVRYVFDEAIGSVSTPGNFFVYRFNDPNNPVPGDQGGTVDPNNPNAVLVRFSTITSTTAVGATGTADLSVATVDFNAVVDTQGLQNPEGDAALGTGQQGSAVITAGRTAGPDLVSIAFRTGSLATNTTVDFVFDQNAFVQNSGAAGFELVRTDASQPNIVCTAPANNQNNTTNPGGGTAPGGNGTTTITTSCANPVGFTPGQLLSPTTVARGIVQSGTVSTTPAAGIPNFTGISGVACGPTAANAEGTAARCNVLTASDTPDGGTTAPDLVSTTFTPGATGTATPDTVVYTFDQTVATAPAVGSYRVYFNNTTETPATGATQVNSANPTQVAVTFPNGTLAGNGGATGGNITDGAATGAGGQTNQEDEAAATNVTQPAAGSQPAGRTAAPDLTAVAFSTGGTFGTSPLVTYVFDQRINNGTAPVAPVAANFSAWLANGTELVCTSAAFTSTTATTGDPSQSVTCTAFNVVGGGAATAAQIQSAVLGTVDDAAVSDVVGRQNPEGANAITGGNGTPTS